MQGRPQMCGEQNQLIPSQTPGTASRKCWKLYTNGHMQFLIQLVCMKCYEVDVCTSSNLGTLVIWRLLGCVLSAYIKRNVYYRVMHAEMLRKPEMFIKREQTKNTAYLGRINQNEK